MAVSGSANFDTEVAPWPWQPGELQRFNKTIAVAEDASAGTLTLDITEVQTVKSNALAWYIEYLNVRAPVGGAITSDAGMFFMTDKSIETGVERLIAVHLGRVASMNELSVGRGDNASSEHGESPKSWAKSMGWMIPKRGQTAEAFSVGFRKTNDNQATYSLDCIAWSWDMNAGRPPNLGAFLGD